MGRFAPIFLIIPLSSPWRGEARREKERKASPGGNTSPPYAAASLSASTSAPPRSETTYGRRCSFINFSTNAEAGTSWVSGRSSSELPGSWENGEPLAWATKFSRRCLENLPLQIEGPHQGYVGLREAAAVTGGEVVGQALHLQAVTLVQVCQSGTPCAAEPSLRKTVPKATADARMGNMVMRLPGQKAHR